MRFLRAILAALLFVTSGSAWAAQAWPDEGAAFAGCIAAAAGAQAKLSSTWSSYRCVVQSATQFQGQLQSKSNGGWADMCGIAGHGFECQHSFPLDKKCSNVKSPVYAGYQEVGASRCEGGCEYVADNAPVERRRYDRPNGNSINFQRGYWRPSGGTCAVGPAPEPPRDDYCAMLDGGHKVCRDNQGRECVTSGKTGRRYCSPKNGPTNATEPTRNENVNISAPSPSPGTPPTPPTPRPGEDWKKSASASSTDVTNNVTQNIEINNNTGTPNTNPGDGNPNDGGDNPGEGEGEGDKGSASGGAGCDAPPVCSGDPINCAVLDQSWRNRCASSKGDANGNGRPDWTELSEGEGSDGVTPGNGQDEKAQSWGLESLLDKVDDSGFIGQSCPSIPMFDLGPLGSFDPNGDWWCETLDLIGSIFVFVASCAAVRILVS